MTMPARARSAWLRQRGFTLVELLVALLVMSLLGLMAWRGLDGMALARSDLQGRSDAVRTLQSGLAQWQADWDALFTPAAPAPASSAAATSAVSRVTPQALDWNGAVLRMTREDRSLQEPALRVVAWSRRSAADGGGWVRWQSDALTSPQAWQQAWANALRWGQAAGTALDAQSVTVVGLQGWSLYYYRNDAWSNPASSAEQAALMPDGVRLVLDLAPGQALGGRVTRDWVRPTLAGNKP